MNFKTVKYAIGWLLIFEAAFFLIPLVTALVYSEFSDALSFLYSALVALALGALLTVGRPFEKKLGAKDGFVIVSLGWIVLSLIGALPFMFSGVTENYVDALFETASGFTTTGASVLSNLEALPRSIIMWRSFLAWIGGMGVLVFVMAFLPLGGSSMHLMKAESPGPSVSKLVPRIKTTAIILYGIYFAMTLVQFVLLLAGGIGVFEALNLAFATAGTGGFAPRSDSIASYSPYIQIVITVFMLLFSLNFNAYYLVMKRRLRDAFNTEIKVFLVIVASAIIIITLSVAPSFTSLTEAVRHVAFTVASIISSTGFTTVDFNAWSAIARTVLILLMLVGACAGSTGGGIKVSRFVLLWKQFVNEMQHLIRPRQVKKLTLDKKEVDGTVLRALNTYITAYILIFAVSAVIVSIDGHDLVTNFTATLACLNNIGPGLEAVGPTQNFAFLSVHSKLVLIFDMIAGRLELFPMLLLFAPSTWRKN